MTKRLTYLPALLACALMLGVAPAGAEHRHRDQRRHVKAEKSDIRKLAQRLDKVSRRLHSEGKQSVRHPNRKERKALSGLRHFRADAVRFHELVDRRKVNERRMLREFRELERAFDLARHRAKALHSRDVRAYMKKARKLMVHLDERVERSVTVARHERDGRRHARSRWRGWWGWRGDRYAAHH